MIKFTYTNPKYLAEVGGDTSSVDIIYTVNNVDVTLNDLLCHFEMFLKSIGYNMDNKYIDVYER
jgi:hypothetical protein